MFVLDKREPKIYALVFSIFAFLVLSIFIFFISGICRANDSFFDVFYDWYQEEQGDQNVNPGVIVLRKEDVEQVAQYVEKEEQELAEKYESGET